MIMNAIGREIPDSSDRKTNIPFKGIGKHHPEGNKAGPPIPSGKNYKNKVLKNIDEALPLNTTKQTLEERGKAIDKGERNKFDTYKSNINKKCKILGIGDLIIKQGDIKKAFKLSVNITKKTLQL